MQLRQNQSFSRFFAQEETIGNAILLQSEFQGHHLLSLTRYNQNSLNTKHHIFHRKIMHKGKPLVCGLFGPHPHAHRTKIVMCGARTRTPFFGPARAPAHFFKKFSKNFFSNFFFLEVFLEKICGCACACRHNKWGAVTCAAHYDFCAMSVRVRAKKSAH